MTGFETGGSRRVPVLWVALAWTWLAASSSAALEDPPSFVRGSEIGDTLKLVRRIEIFHDTASDLTLDEVRDLAMRGKFTPATRFGFTVGGSDAVYWVHIKIHNDIERTHWLLYLPHQRVGELMSYLIVAGEEPVTSRTGFLAPTDVELPTNRVPVVAIHVPTGRTADVFLRLEDVAIVTLPLRLASDPAFNAWNRRDELLFGSTLGMLFAALVYLAGNWRLVPNVSLVALSGFVVFCALYIAVSSGYTRDFIGFLGARPTTFLMNASILGVWLSALLFGRNFLDTPKALPRSDRLIRIGIYLCLAALVASPFFGSEVRLALITVINPLFLLIFVISGVAAVRKDLPGARPYLLSAVCIIFGSLMRNFIDVGWVPLNELTASALYVGLAASALILALAISEKIRHERRESEARNRAIVQSSLDAIVSLYPDGEIIEFNPSAEATFGYPRNWAIGRKIWDLIIPERLRKEYADRLQRFLVNSSIDGSLAGSRVELVGKRAHGGEFPIEVAMAPGRVRETEFFTAHIRDLTEAKHLESELNEKREALFQSEKLGALGSLLAGVAHELNNPLSVIVGRSSMLRDTSDNDRTRTMADKIHDAAQRCARIIRTFLAMARQRPQERQVVSINDTVEAALDLIVYNLRADGIDVETVLDPDLPDTMADPDQLIQVLINLVVNAQHALEAADGERKLRLNTRRRGERLEIVVEDSGRGVPETIRTRIFDPFFTTKPVGTGTGLGLSVSRGMIESHGGTIELATSPLGGACFVVAIPLVEPLGQDRKSRSAPAATKDMSILIVDDDQEAGEALAGMLRPRGWRATVVGSAEAGLETLETQEFDLILSDVRMPGVSGADFYEALARRHARYRDRILFITGDTVGADTQRLRDRTRARVLEKPIEPEALIAALQEISSRRAEPVA